MNLILQNGRQLPRPLIIRLFDAIDEYNNSKQREDQRPIGGDFIPGRTVQHHYVAGALYDAGVVYVAGANPSLHTPSGTSSIYVAGANGCSGSLGQQVRKHFCQIQHHQRLLAASSKFAGKPPCDLESLVPSANVGAAWAYTSWKIFTTGKATPIGPALPRTHEI